MIKIAVIPIDNRPVCYCLPKDIADFSSEIEFMLPPREYMGGLIEPAQTDKILSWLKSIDDADILILALDTIAYGGLVSSRRTNEAYEQIEQRLSELKAIIVEKGVKTYAFSSIMRISNNNINEEEKEYWNVWGKKIFDYSFNIHKAQKMKSYDSNAKFSCISQIIPSEILDDYFATRKRNFEINRLYLEWQEKGVFEYLVFSKDDCAEFGANVAEAEELEKIISQNKAQALIKTGADEIPLSLLARAFSEFKNQKTKIHTQFTRPQETNLISKYEDISIYNSVKGQIELCGAEIADKENADIILYINNFKKEQGELVMGVSTEPFTGKFQIPEKPFIIGDVAFANGSDNGFIPALFENKIDSEKFLGYAGWNTSANTLGSALCAGIIKYLSSDVNYNKFKRQQYIRFADDWAYQANCRERHKQTSASPNIEQVSILMKPYLEIISEKIGYTPNQVDFKFPWDRFFEIEIMPKD